MRNKKRGQIGVEYMIIVGFVTFAVMSILALAMIYSNQIKDRIRSNQAENFANQLVNSAESVFFKGKPSKVTINLYLPEGVEDLQIRLDGTEYILLMTVHTSSGNNTRAYHSRVPIQGAISTTGGTKRLTLEVITAGSDILDISEA